MNMGELVMMVGGLAVLFGAFDLLDFGDYGHEWKKPWVKVFGGLVVACIGALMNFFWNLGSTTDFQGGLKWQ